MNPQGGFRFWFCIYTFACGSSSFTNRERLPRAWAASHCIARLDAPIVRMTPFERFGSELAGSLFAVINPFTLFVVNPHNHAILCGTIVAVPHEPQALFL